MTNQPLDFVPMWAMYFLTVLAMLATMEAGFRLNQILRRRSPDKTDVGLGGMVGASLGLLAFLLAFVVGFGANINTERRHLVVDAPVILPSRTGPRRGTCCASTRICAWPG
jgi:hypothetical protein